MSALRLTLARAAAPAIRPRAVASSSRLLSSSAVRRSDDHPPVLIQGEGAKAGETPSNFQQATGLERFELLGRMQGIDVFDMKPLDASRTGTTKNPIVIQSLHPTRLVGCTGSPAGSHDTLWIEVGTKIKHHRCKECGSVYAMDYIGKPEGGHH